MNNNVLKTVLTSSVGEHIAAFRALSDCKPEEIAIARKALRAWIGTQKDSPEFGKLDDLDILSVLLEEFANFAIFCGEQVQEENQQTFQRTRSFSVRGGNC